jgi:surface polysaccharide O-acyltransferase-like enzyme
MKLNWFIRKGIFYLPAAVAGWFIFALAFAYAVYTFIDIDKRSHSVSDTLINFVFNLLIIGLFYTVIAYFTEKKPDPAATDD